MNVKELIQLDTAGRNVNWNSSLKNNFELSGEAEDTHNIMILFLESGTCITTVMTVLLIVEKRAISSKRIINCGIHI